MVETSAVKSSAMAGILKEAVKQAKARAAESDKANAAAAKSGGFKSTPVGDAVMEKLVRAEVEARKDAIIEAAIAEAVASL